VGEKILTKPGSYESVCNLKNWFLPLVQHVQH